MPPEHELIFSMMASILHACRKNSKIDLKVVRLKLVRAKRAAGLRGRYNWSNSVKHGVDRVCDILRGRLPQKRWTMWRHPTQDDKIQQIIAACEVALKKPRLLGSLHERTWQEQIVGRATVASKTYFPDA